MQALLSVGFKGSHQKHVEISNGDFTIILPSNGDMTANTFEEIQRNERSSRKSCTRHGGKKKATNHKGQALG